MSRTPHERRASRGTSPAKTGAIVDLLPHTGGNSTIAGLDAFLAHTANNASGAGIAALRAPFVEPIEARR
jgi:hypothetical protein